MREGDKSDKIENEVEEARLSYRKRFIRTLISTVCIFAVVAAAAVFVSMVFLPVLKVSGDGMSGTLEDGDVIVLIRTDDIATGDVIGFYYQNKLLLKRVIAGPGDVIDIDTEGNVTVNDVALDEPYLTEKSLGQTDIVYPYQVPEGRYFVMGDNREVSVDSRRSEVGCIDARQVVGRAVLRVWPLRNASFIN